MDFLVYYYHTYPCRRENDVLRYFCAKNNNSRRGILLRPFFAYFSHVLDMYGISWKCRCKNTLEVIRDDAEYFIFYNYNQKTRSDT